MTERSLLFIAGVLILVFALGSLVCFRQIRTPIRPDVFRWLIVAILAINFLVGLAAIVAAIAGIKL